MAKIGATGLAVSLSLLALGLMQLQAAQGDSTGTCGWSCLQCSTSNTKTDLSSQAQCVSSCNLVNGTTDITTTKNDIGTPTYKVDAQACCKECKELPGCKSFVYNPDSTRCNFKSATVTTSTSLNLTSIPYQVANVCFCSYA